MNKTYTHTVVCFDDKTLTESFEGIEAAAEYANDLLKENHQVKIYPYRPRKSYIDIVAEQGPEG